MPAARVAPEYKDFQFPNVDRIKDAASTILEVIRVWEENIRLPTDKRDPRWTRKRCSEIIEERTFLINKFLNTPL